MLNCTAMCRGMDKKPCGNILGAFSIRELATKGFKADTLLGGSIMKSTKLTNRPASAFIGMKNVGSIKAAGFSTTVTSILDTMSESTAPKASISAVIDEDSLGKPLPLCRVTGTE